MLVYSKSCLPSSIYSNKTHSFEEIQNHYYANKELIQTYMYKTYRSIIQIFLWPVRCQAHQLIFPNPIAWE